ncbi:nuclear speckle splicing regulatory protein 1 isoform X2 [Prorops nasuta]|uniref:nuclear speckle splicing regulatory protein 1 isoform X2 n=1 Tax=Prorops nasuta TaxID=863751 RepID=UPI0034CD268D
MSLEMTMDQMKKMELTGMQKALNEDPTIYQYDEVYDDMERTKAQAKVNKVEVKKPNYIQHLLKAAKRRKKEQEHRIERMVQKEREAEGNMYADKESFVTSAYKAKLEEFKKMEEEEARMQRLEEIGDVTKQQDMSGFYRHLFDQTIENVKTDEKLASSSAQKTDSHIDDKNDTSSNNEDDNKKILTRVQSKSKRIRQYRKRVLEASESDSEPEESITKCNANKRSSPLKEHTEHNATQLEGNKIESLEPEKEVKKSESMVKIDNSNNDIDATITNAENSFNSVSDDKNNKIDSKTIKKQETAISRRSSIWEKRMVGHLFEAAVERYYQRKAMRTASI